MYIQPCCIEKELPALLRQSPFAFFQSNGDWLATDLMKSVSCLVSGAVALIAIDEADVFLLRTLRTYLAKDWYRGVILCTARQQTEQVESELAGYLDRVTYVGNPQIVDGMFALANASRYLVVQGPLLAEKDFSLCQYAGYFGSEAAPFRAATEALTAKVKTSAFLRSKDEWVEAVIHKRNIE